jgi:hypothetical protein
MDLLNPVNWSESTSLSQLNLPFFEVVLAERFLLPSESLRRFNLPVPTTLGELCEASGMPMTHVVKVIKECIAIDQDVWSDAALEDFLDVENRWIVDMRPGLDLDAEALHPRARIFHHGNPAAQLDIMRSMDQILVLSKPLEHAWSAAMSLRQMGVRAVVLKSR